MSAEIARYEKMLKANNAAIKKLNERSKLIAAVIKALKAVEVAPEVEEVQPTTPEEGGE